MISYQISLTEVNPVTNEIKVFIERKPDQELLVHQAVIKINADDALKLIDELKGAVKKLSESK